MLLEFYTEATGDKDTNKMDRSRKRKAAAATSPDGQGSAVKRARIPVSTEVLFFFTLQDKGRVLISPSRCCDARKRVVVMSMREDAKGIRDA